MNINYKQISVLLISVTLLLIPGQIFCQLSGWQYKVRVDISNKSSNARTDYQELIVINTKALIAANQMQTTGADIRFGDTCFGSVTILPHYLMSGINTDTTRIWVLLSSLPAGKTKSIYMYYGNTGASSTSSFSGVFKKSFISSGKATLSGSVNYDWFEIQKNDTLYVTKGAMLNLKSRVFILSGTLNANGAGIDSGVLASNGKGPGGGKTSGNNSAGSGGAGYGGYGGQGGYDAGDMVGDSGKTYGTVWGSDIAMGSSGASSDLALGGAGGGGVSIESAYIECTGNIWANGNAGAGSQARNGGGGSGGGVMLKGSTIIVTGKISANGGDGGVGTASVNDDGGGGGGGRIKIFYGSKLTGNYTLEVKGGIGGPNGTAAPGGNGAAGSKITKAVAFPDDSIAVIGLFVTLSHANGKICKGTPLVLTANKGFNNYIFYLNSSQVQSGSNSSFTYKNLKSGDNISVTASVTACYTATSSVKVTVDTLPAVSIQSVNELCERDTLKLVAGGALTYQWKNGPKSANWTLVPAKTDNYEVIGTDGNNCSDTVSKSVIRHTYPTVSVSNDTTICQGDSVKLTVTGASTVSWEGGKTGNSIFVNPASAEFIVFSAYNVKICQITDSIKINVNPLPNVFISGKASVCEGGTTTLGANGGTYFKWSTGSTNFLLTVSPLVNTEYWVKGTDNNGCTNIAYRTVVVDTIPNVTVTGKLKICKGESTRLTANNAAVYAWNTGSKDSSILVKPASNATYTVIGRNDKDCIDTTTVNVIVNPLPVVTFTLPGDLDTVCLNDAPWPLSGGAPSGGTYSGRGVTGASFNASAAGVGKYLLMYKYSDINGCSDSAGTPIVVDYCAKLYSNSNLNITRIYPNPSTNGQFIVSGNPGQYSVWSISGKMIFSFEKNTGDYLLNLEYLNSGYYIIKTADLQTFKLAIMR